MKQLIIILVLLFSFNVDAGVNKGVGIGPLYGYDNTSDSHIYGLDLSYSLFIATASLQPRLFLEENSSKNYALDLQFTVWYLVNFGGGLGYKFSNNEALNYHLFLGLPLPIPILSLGDSNQNKSSERLFNSLYIEPYYRYNYYNDFNSHEFGIMIKINTFEVLTKGSHCKYEKYKNTRQCQKGILIL